MMRASIRTSVEKLTLTGVMVGLGIAVFLVASGGFAQSGTLPTKEPAPEIHSLSWINSDAPLRLESLRGKVVLLEFWTFDCINCIHTLPYVEQWHELYGDQGLVVMGIHYPEFGYEHDLQNVYAATQRLNVSYPVGIDNDGATWNAYGQRYWPTIYLIDKQGNLRYLHIGEGAYTTTEATIQTLLAEDYAPEASSVDATAEPQMTPAYLTPDTDLNVRSAPGTDNAQIGAISPGMAFVILGEQDGWYEISYNDGRGYVSGDYVTVHDS